MRDGERYDGPDGSDTWGPMHDGWGGDDMGAGGWVLMILGLLLLLALLVAVVLLVVRMSSPGPTGTRGPSGPQTPDRPDPGAAARTILDERFARGEIDEDEYRQRLAVLRGG